MDRESEKIEKAKRLFREGNLPGAERRLRKVVDKIPTHLEALYLLGVLLHRMARPEEAVRYLARAARIQPGNPDIHNTLGAALCAAERTGEAIESWTRAISLAPAMLDALVNRANLYAAQGRFDEAGADFEAAIEIDSGAIVFYLRLAETNILRGALERALVTLDAARSVDPRSMDVHCVRGNVLSDLSRFDEALCAYDAAIKLEPAIAGLYLNKAQALAALGRIDETLRSYDQAIALAPEEPDVYVAKAETLSRLSRFEESFALFNMALTLHPNHKDALAGRAANLHEAGYLKDALRDYETLAELRGDENDMIELRGFIRRQMCDWSLVPAELSKIRENLQKGKEIASAFAILSISDAEEVNSAAARLMCRQQASAPVVATEPTHAAPSEKIRLAYFSADFHDHATAHLLTRVLELTDRDRFELSAFSFGPDIDDYYRARIAAAVDTFLDVRSFSDEAVARLARERGVEIAVDLKGLTKGNRIGIFAQRAAPIQVSFLGYPGSLGADFVDYIVADGTVVSHHNRASLAEKIIYLPDCYQPNDPDKAISNKRFTRAEVGLPEEGFVYCCFNNSYKILPQVFDVWMRILRQVLGAVLWLIADNEWASENLRQQAQNRGVDGDRLVFSPRLPLAEHLARHRLADLFLDTRPYNAHTTASDALFVGVPVLTCPGETFAGRVGASLVAAAGLPELIADDLPSYEAIAIELAIQPDRLQSMKRRLRENGRASALFDAKRYARNLEQAFVEIHRRHNEGLAPDDIYVAAHPADG